MAWRVGCGGMAYRREVLDSVGTTGTKAKHSSTNTIQRNARAPR